MEKSGGNFGVGLAYEAGKYGIGVDLVIGLSFSPLKRALCEEYGAKLVGIDMLKSGLQPKDAIALLLEAHGEDYFFTDQFGNAGNVEAHLRETGPELARQIAADLSSYAGCILVVAAGTGASAKGISSALRERFDNVIVVLNQPANCDYRQGVFGEHLQKGTAVGVMPPFLDLSSVDLIAEVSDAEAIEGQQQLARESGVYAGPSAGANYFLSCKLAKEHPDRLVVTLIYDGGEGYLHGRMTA